jgi:hypothetical protein
MTRPADADPVTDWNANAGKAAIASCISPANDPLHESRLYAMMHIAIHDALNAIDRRSQPYAFNRRVDRPTSVDAAVAAAAHDVLVPVIGQLPFPPECVQAGIQSVEADYAAALAAVPPGAAKTRGIELGQAAAAAIHAVRGWDGSDTPLTDPGYPQGTAPGEYRFTPGFNFAFAPGWGNVTPFALRRSSQFRADPPLDVRSRRYAADFNEVKRLGGDGVTTPHARTPEQTEIGLFWLESSPLAWNRLARSVSARRGLDRWENARLFGLLNIALADGYIGSWEGKYFYNFWRPVTAIQNADTDGNPDTRADPTWTPLQLTYPMPDHDSAHSVEGGAAAEVVQLDAAGREQMLRCVSRHPQVHQLLPGRERERPVTDSRGHSFPSRRRGRHSTRPPDRPPCRRSVHEARALTLRKARKTRKTRNKPFSFSCFSCAFVLSCCEPGHYVGLCMSPARSRLEPVHIDAKLLQP